MPKNVFILGPDPSNLEALRSLPDASDYVFHTLLEYDAVKERPDYPLPDLLAEAESQLSRFSGTIDAIIGYWDFPVSSLLALLIHRHGLPGPSLESLARCEHKYWGRLEQLHSVPEATPLFAKVDPFDPNAAELLRLPFPFWLKPIKSLRSHLAFMVRDEEDLATALHEIRSHIARIGEPFDYFLSQVHLSEGISPDDGLRCIAEEPLSGHQCTLEGYVSNHQVYCYGIVDSVRDPNKTTFARYEYPSILSEDIQARMRDLARRFISYIELNQCAFNIEFFYDEKHDRIWILEINPRVSQSHSYLFQQVDGVSNLEATVKLALGEPPRLSYRQGPHSYAAKFFIRHYQDAIVRRVPTPDEIDAISRRVPGTEIYIHVHEDMRLSELWDQDSYSFEVATLLIAAEDRSELTEKYEECVQSLDFSFSVPLADLPVP